MILFFSLTLMFSILILINKHPLSLGAILLAQTIIISLMVGMMNLNYWYSYILFIIMIGAMLILFIYMTSIASNEMFSMNYLYFLLFIIPSMTMIIYMFMDKFLSYMNLTNFEINNYYLFTNFSFSMNKFINFPNNIIMIMTIIFLLISLLITVKITKIFKGPLRKIN
uniref:NADH-ubiquinone oxidoreductase chain 6 n=1 Tax=Idgia oculata TaxID=1404354 RepID=A0A5J6CGI8_9CUCU|nr:NADH dehydrogenase subunit 6 [Idgia oculata]QEQ14410.1 NADH dehydrogenase subunit 6 [Idgia oculata]